MKLLLIEDDEKIADLIVNGMQRAGFTVEHSPDGQQGGELLQQRVYDVAIVDVLLPGVDGFTLVERARQAHIATPILILSAKREVEDRVKGLMTGGDDYLTKPFAFAELLARVQALVRRAQGSAAPTALGVADLTLNVISREVARGGAKIELSLLEFDLLKYLLENAGRVVSKAMLLKDVWQYNFDPATNIVETRVCKLRDKIDRGAAVKLIHTIRGVGYVARADG